MTLLSPHFDLSEFERSERADRLGISNKANMDQLLALKALAQNIMEPIRVRAGLPITITSGLRVDELNEATPGSSKTSQHRTGQACDFTIKGVSPSQACLWIFIRCSDLPWDQMILEYANPMDPSRGWVHISHVAGGPNRKQVLHASKEFKGYRSGLPDWVNHEPRTTKLRFVS